MHVETFTQGKTEKRNEDFFGYNDSTFVLADGATDKSGKTYDGKTGGEIISKLIVKTCLETNLNGPPLVSELNNRVLQIYHNLDIADEVRKIPQNRFSGTFVCIRIIAGELIATILGDVSYRLNKTEVHLYQKQIDIDNANLRAQYIEETGDIMGSRRFLYPHLIKQYAYQNLPNHPLGYGAVDGSTTPDDYVKMKCYPLSVIQSIEIFSDGYYYQPPMRGITPADWEARFKEIHKADPHKYQTYKSTKSIDDRTVMTITF